MTIEELNNYYDSLCDKYKRGKTEIVLNADRAHNSVIEKFMLDFSTNIKMYCGEMSVFRDGFYTHIDENNKHNDCKDVFIGKILKENLCTSLINFINKPDTTLRIFLDRYEKSFFDDLIEKTIFRRGIVEGKISLYKLKDNLFKNNKAFHMSIADDKIIRLERDIDTHEAICTIHASDDIVSSVNKAFELMPEIFEEVNLKE